jgi:hypothetical protein
MNRALCQGINFVHLPITHLPPVIKIIPLPITQSILLTMPRSLLRSTARSQHPLPCTADGYNHHSFAETLVGFLQNRLDWPDDPLQVIDVQVRGRTPSTRSASAIDLLNLVIYLLPKTSSILRNVESTALFTRSKDDCFIIASTIYPVLWQL